MYWMVIQNSGEPEYLKPTKPLFTESTLVPILQKIVHA